MLRPITWPCLCPGQYREDNPADGSPAAHAISDELALACDQGSAVRILVLPALFDEANKLRHFALEVMRQLSQNGFDTFLPDFAGCNESTAPLHWQTIAGWQEQARAAASHFRATHVLTLRAGALLDPGE